MDGLVATLLAAPADRRIFLHRGAWVTAGDIRALAARAAAIMNEADERVFLHTSRASYFVAGLLAAAARGKHIVMPAHAQSVYLDEIGCRAGLLFDDARIAGATDARIDLSVARRDPLMVFFTSGSTATPKPVEKNLSRLEIETHALDALWGRQATHVIATVSHQHIYGLLYRVAWPILSGRTADDEAALYWEDLEHRTGGATLISSPAHLTRLPPREDFFAERPALAFSSGQLLPADAAAHCARAFGARVIEVLGSTETGGIAWRQQESAQTPWTPFPAIRLVENDENEVIVVSPYLQTDAPLATGDTLERLADGRFRLKPRGDRVAKIEGKRVSLTRVENGLRALPEIAAATALALPKRRDALGAIVTLTPYGRAALVANGAFRLTRQLRRAASAQLEPAERPKHWRFVEAIPTDSQGKHVLSELQALFEQPESPNSDPLRTLTLDVRSRTETQAEIAFALAPELVFFDGHFPGQPILPGVAQVHIAALLAQKLWGVWPSESNLARVKFRRTLLPSDFVVVKLSRKPDTGRVTFSFHLGEEEVSRGEIGAS
ncbi:MAG TPA: AMP-binding protein [Caulobacterales bacterium]|nr:AMP-binding protein [Caulobacterales bacterium]